MATDTSAPALRDRSGDVELLTNIFLDAINEEFSEINSAYKPRKLSPQALKILKQHNWPGNVRELESALKAACLWTVKPIIDAVTMQEAIPRSPSKTQVMLQDHLETGFDLRQLLAEVKHHYVNLALRLNPNNRSAAAKSLGATDRPWLPVSNP